ncbi:MAG: serine/threonine protein kinase, partial [Chloroflexi bacterium]|nr:serine/threonine protein kinase [Chloroflexota bacterium]
MPTSSGTIAVAGRYRLDALRGQGSSATVYAATDLRLNRPVTVKLFDPGVAADPSLRARFRRQTAKASRLAHPHVAEILDAGFATEPGDGERPFVVTEPAGRWSLRELLDREGRIPPRQAVKLAHQLASALSYAHRQGTIHADVKPENVLVDDGGEQAKLVDFSLSFVSAKTGATTRETIARRAAYLAPEQVRGEPVGPTTDVYGLGVLLYEMLAGRPPFVAATPEATAERRVLEHARPVGAFDPSIPAGVEAVIARALERAPERRWPTVEQLDAELSRFDTSQLEPVDLGSLPQPTSAVPTSPRPAGRR